MKEGVEKDDERRRRRRRRRNKAVARYSRQTDVDICSRAHFTTHSV